MQQVYTRLPLSRVVAPPEGLAASAFFLILREMLSLPLPLPVCRLSNFNIIYEIVQCRERSRYIEKISGFQPLERTNKKLRTAHLSLLLVKSCAES